MLSVRPRSGRGGEFHRDRFDSFGRLFPDVTPTGVEVRSGGAEGAFYAVQTLRQLMPGGGIRKGTGRRLSNCRPSPSRTGRKGVSRNDARCCRHFFTVEEVKRVLDLLAMHKMNVFHWHLTDDQGWRIEIGKYPELTRIGSVRTRTLIGKDPGGEYDETCRYDETPHGGFYTQDEIQGRGRICRPPFHHGHSRD